MSRHIYDQTGISFPTEMTFVCCQKMWSAYTTVVYYVFIVLVCRVDLVDLVVRCVLYPYILYVRTTFLRAGLRVAVALSLHGPRHASQHGGRRKHAAGPAHH